MTRKEKPYIVLTPSYINEVVVNRHWVCMHQMHTHPYSRPPLLNDEFYRKPWEDFPTSEKDQPSIWKINTANGKFLNFSDDIVWEPITEMSKDRQIYLDCYRKALNYKGKLQIIQFRFEVAEDFTTERIFHKFDIRKGVYSLDVWIGDEDKPAETREQWQEKINNYVEPDKFLGFYDD